MTTELFVLNAKTGRIRGTPTETFGQGGNFLPAGEDKRDITSLRGKATPGSTIAIPLRKNGNQRKFIRLGAAAHSPGNTRCELATGPSFPFGQTITFDFSFRLSGFLGLGSVPYVLQFWQPVISPIAGVRVDASKKAVEVVARSAGGAVSLPLRENRWYNLLVTFRAGNDGILSVSDPKSGLLLGRTRPGLTINGGSQASQATSDNWRPKLGFYGTKTKGPLSIVDVRRFAVNRV